MRAIRAHIDVRDEMLRRRSNELGREIGRMRRQLIEDRTT